MELSDSEKIKKTEETLKCFAEMFGENDLSKEALFDVILSVIYGEELDDDVLVLSETGQTDNTDTNNPKLNELPTYEIE